jgi:hypothetical protein
MNFTNKEIMNFFKAPSVKLVTVIFFCVLTSACSSSKLSKSDLVESYSKTAVEKCGKGNVKKVTTKGFVCK